MVNAGLKSSLLSSEVKAGNNGAAKSFYVSILTFPAIEFANYLMQRIAIT